MGAGLGIDEDGLELYEEAAERLLAHLLSATRAYAEAVAILLEHLDNNVGKLVRLVSGMLARREAMVAGAARERRRLRTGRCGPA